MNTDKPASLADLMLLAKTERDRQSRRALIVAAWIFVPFVLLFLLTLGNH